MVIMFGLFKKQQQDFKADVLPTGDIVHLKRGDNLLKAALAAGLDWPHDCRVGSCGTCVCKLKEGKIKELSDFAYVLDGDQLNEGKILACQTQLKSDIVVEVELGAGEDMARAIASIEGVIEKTRMLTHDIMEVTITLDTHFQHSAEPDVDGHAYRAGQYADISFPGIEKPRSYSFAKAPYNEGEKELTFFVRKVPGGELTTWLFGEDRVGSRVTVEGPYGSFWLREGEGPIFCIAGGSGMSSIMALLEHANKTATKRETIYIFGARTQQDLYCLDELKALEASRDAAGGNLRFIPVLSDEPEDSDWSGLRGMCTEAVAAQVLDWTNTHAYLCGPPPMIDAAIEVLKQAGVSSDNIHFDKFLDASSMPSGRK
jgi:xylene monooxygenase electron transfer component